VRSIYPPDYECINPSYTEIKPVLAIINPVFQSLRGRLFAGTTPLLDFGGNKSAWARLVNPCSSRVDLFLAFFLFTNSSENPYSVDILVNAAPPGYIYVSPDVGNLNAGSDNKPVGRIQFNPSTGGKPAGGTRIAPRRIPGNNTFGYDAAGRAIVVPGTSLLFFLTSDKPAKAQVELEWWEEPIARKM
jgi:hypothetical protein